MVAKFKISSWTVNEKEWKKYETHKLNCLFQVSCLAPITVNTKKNEVCKPSVCA